MSHTKLILFSVFFVSAIMQMPLQASTRSEKLKPKWMTQAVPDSKTDDYFFVTARGVGESLNIARTGAMVNLYDKLEKEHNLKKESKYESLEAETITEKSSTGIINHQIKDIFWDQGQEIDIICKIIDEYWVEDHGRYDVSILYTIYKNTSAISENEITVTAKYGAAGFLSIVPGVGQYYKGSVVKGSLIIAGEVVAAGGIILCENTRASYIKKMQEHPKHAAEYNSLADSWETGRNICIGAAAAIYLYNLIDAFASNGAKHIRIKKEKSYFSAVPYADSQCVGVGLAFKF